MQTLLSEMNHLVVDSGHGLLPGKGWLTMSACETNERSILRLWQPCLRRSRCDRGNVVVEFALALPVLLLMLLASAELGRFVLLNQKIDRVAVTMSDLVARAETINESELNDIFNAAAQVAAPFDLNERGRVIISSVINEDGEGATIAWQRAGGGSFLKASEVGTEGGVADLPEDFDVREGETAIISEVFFDFEPFLSELIVTPRVIYRRAHHRPRLGTLDTIESD